ncbi:MAG: hypothetical protein CSA05_00635 [Bacteroidia bacterium]|nr:MAG: hypothetical protein CSB01_00390 [Bacteroidia bacterium]PIE86403.1 MAG: hypothetical protein CSA05_00635 [Bacteroidia bacterium]
MSAASFKYDIFLSFASQDTNEARLVWKKLSKAGFRVFWSDEVLKNNIGKSFFMQLEDALKESKHFVLLASPNATKSPWVKTEYETFYNTYFLPENEARRLIILKAQKFDFSLLPAILHRLQFSNTPEEIITILRYEISQDVHSQEYDDAIFSSKQQTINLKKVVRTKTFQFIVLSLVALLLAWGILSLNIELEPILHEKKVWENAKQENTIKAYRHYLDKFPDGIYLKFAQKRIKKLKRPKSAEEQMWELVVKTNRKESYEKYLKQYPKGKYAIKATAMLSAFDKKQPVDDDFSSPKEAEDFLRLFFKNLQAYELHNAFRKTENPELKTEKDFGSSRHFGKYSKISINILKNIYFTRQEACYFCDFLFVDILDNKKKGEKIKFYLERKNKAWKIVRYMRVESYDLKQN